MSPVILNSDTSRQQDNCSGAVGGACGRQKAATYLCPLQASRIQAAWVQHSPPRFRITSNLNLAPGLKASWFSSQAEPFYGARRDLSDTPQAQSQVTPVEGFI